MVVDVCRLSVYKPYMAVYARAAVPAAVFLLRVVGFHRYGIAAGLQIGRDVAEKRRVAVGMTAGAMAVDIYVRGHIHALEIEL